MNYHVYDEDGELIRRFYTRQEAEYWCNQRPGFTLQFHRQPKYNPWDKVAHLPESPF